MARFASKIAGTYEFWTVFKDGSVVGTGGWRREGPLEGGSPDGTEGRRREGVMSRNVIRRFMPGEQAHEGCFVDWIARIV